jgi:hypothetical protein
MTDLILRQVERRLSQFFYPRDVQAEAWLSLSEFKELLRDGFNLQYAPFENWDDTRGWAVWADKIEEYPGIRVRFVAKLDPYETKDIESEEELKKLLAI